MNKSDASSKLCSNSLYQTAFVTWHEDIFIGLDSSSEELLKQAVENNGDSELAGISDLYCLELLHLNIVEKGKISDISHLSGLTNLVRLRLDYSNVSDISPLQGLTKLEVLSLHSSKVQDLSPLANLENLKSLSLFGTPVSDVSPLFNLTSLETLGLNETNVSGEDCRELQAMFPKKVACNFNKSP